MHHSLIKKPFAYSYQKVTDMSGLVPTIIFVYFISIAAVLVVVNDNANKPEDICEQIKLHKQEINSGISPFEAKGHPAPTKEIKKACDYG